MQHLIFMFASAAPSAGVVTITNASANADDFGAGANECEAGFRWNADGTLERNERNSGGGDDYQQVSASTDWIIPNAGSSTTYYIRGVEDSYTENETNIAIFSSRNGTMGTWLTLGGGQAREWSLTTNSNSAGAGDITWVVDFDIATDSGGTNIIASGTMTMTGLVG